MRLISSPIESKGNFPPFISNVKTLFYTVKTVEIRNGIPSVYRYLDASYTTLCYVTSEQRVYELVNNPETEFTTNSDWAVRFRGDNESAETPIGNWNAEYNVPELSDEDAEGINGQYYYVWGAPSGLEVTIPGMFGDDTVTVRDGDIIVSTGTKWVHKPNNIEFAVPTELLVTQLVNTISDRNDLPRWTGMRVIVLDATGDEFEETEDDTAAEYIYQPESIIADEQGFVLVPNSSVDVLSLMLDAGKLKDVYLSDPLVSIGNLSVVSGDMLYATGVGEYSKVASTSYGRSLLNLADAGELKELAGLVIGTNVQAYNANLTTWAGLVPSANAQSLVTAANYAAMRALLDLEAGTDFLSPSAIAAAYAALSHTHAAGDVTSGTFADARIAASNVTQHQSALSIAWSQLTGIDAEIAAIAGLTSANNKIIRFTGSGTAGLLDYSTDSTMASASDTLIYSGLAVKSYLDNALTGLKWKAAVACATTANITLSGEQTIDGVVTSGSRVLVKNQSTASQNGIYVSAVGAWTRATDADAGSELVSATVFVTGGTANADTQWTCTNDSITIGSTSIVWAQVSGAGTYSAGTGLQLSGNQFSISDSELLALAGLVSAADRVPYFTGAGTAALATFTSFGRSLVDDADAATARVTLGFTNPILDKDSPGDIGGTTRGAGYFTTISGGNILIATSHLFRIGNNSAISESLIYGENQHASFTGSVAFFNSTAAAASTYNLLRLRSAGVDRFIVDGLGNVGIGTTSPSSPLHIYSTGANLLQFSRGTGNYYIGQTLNTNDLWFAEGAPTGSIRLYLQAGGNVGIGTSSPSNLLSVSKNQNSATIIEHSNTTVGSGAAAQIKLISDSGNGYVYRTSSAWTGVVPASSLALQDDNQIAFRTGASLKWTINNSGHIVPTGSVTLGLSGTRITTGYFTALDATNLTLGGTGLSANGVSLITAANYAAMRALLDLEAGTDFLSPSSIAAAYQPIDAGLTSIAGLTTAADRMIYTTASDTYAVATLTSFARSLLDDADAATARATLGISTNFVLPNGIGLTEYNSGGYIGGALGGPADLIFVASNIYTFTPITFIEDSSTPGAPDDGTECRVYMKANKIVFQYNDGGTTRYKYLDLTGTGVTWVHSTSAP